MEGRWTLYNARDHGITCYQGKTVPEGRVPVVPCDDAAIERAIEWAMHAGVLPMTEFVEGIVAALADAPLGCPCVGTADQEDCPHA